MTASSQVRGQGTFNQFLDWFDQLPKPAKIGIMVVGFVLFWPVGLAVLGYMLWSGQMGCRHGSNGWGRSHWGAGSFQGYGGRRGSSGNVAFDEYREATLRQLEEDQREFGAFIDRLRRAKDQQEFDDFMADRMKRKMQENGKTEHPGDGQ
jgi:hypothetical protein